MIECAGCGKRLRDNVTYCRICGTKSADGVPGDYSTEMLNVFRHGDEYLYIFAEKGNQVILKSDSLDELERMAKKKRYPWQLKSQHEDNETESAEISDGESDFFKADSLSEKESAESYIPDYDVEKVGE